MKKKEKLKGAARWFLVIAIFMFCLSFSFYSPRHMGVFILLIAAGCVSVAVAGLLSFLCIYHDDKGGFLWWSPPSCGNDDDAADLS